MRQRPVRWKKCEKAAPRCGGNGGATAREDGRTPAGIHEKKDSAGRRAGRDVGGADQEKYLIRRSTASVKIYLPSICVRGFEPLKIFFVLELMAVHNFSIL